MSYTRDQIVAIITQEAQQLGVPVNLALAIANQESGFNPNSVGDNGHSVGLFQLNDQGEGYGMSVAAREDPVANARIALTQVANVMRANPNLTPGEIAAAAQRPKDREGYATAINSALGVHTGSGLFGNLANDFGSLAQSIGTAASGASSLGRVINTPIDLKSFAAQNGIPPEWVNDPQLGPLIQKWDNNQISDAQFFAQAEQTSLWKNTPQAQRTYLADQATDPATLQQTVTNNTAAIATQAKQLGVPLTPQQAQQIAMQAMQNSWSNQQITQAIAAAWSYGNGQNLSGQAQQNVTDIQQLYSEYAVPLSTESLAKQTQLMLSGYQNIDTIKALVEQQAQSLYANNPGLVQAIKQGQSVQDWASPYKQKAAQLLGINPNSIDLSAPMWSQMLKPASNQQTGEALNQSMTLDQWETKLRTDPVYDYDHSFNAIQSASQLAAGLKQTLGFGSAA